MLLRGLLTINSSNTSNSLVVVLHLHNNREHLDNPKEIAVSCLYLPQISHVFLNSSLSVSLVL